MLYYCITRRQVVQEVYLSGRFFGGMNICKTIAKARYPWYLFVIAASAEAAVFRNCLIEWEARIPLMFISWLLYNQRKRFDQRCEDAT